MPRYNDALSGTSRCRIQKMAPEDELQGMINQGALMGHLPNKARMIELQRQIEMNKLKERSEDKNQGIPFDSVIFPRIDTYGIKKGTVNIGGVVIA